MTNDQSVGCVIETRDGERTLVGGLSVTQAKKVRRADARIVITKENGNREMVQGSQIKRIYPLPRRT